MLFIFFVFKQKTAYEIRPRDWSSDVCSSDLAHIAALGPAGIVDPERRLAAGEGDFPHRDPDARGPFEVHLAGIGEDAAVGGKTQRRNVGRWLTIVNALRLCVFASLRLNTSRSHDHSPHFEERRPRDDGWSRPALPTPV